jgi:ABC-2 type transport system permease protein
VSRPASPLAATTSQASMELRLTARRGENVLVIAVIPVVVLVFFTVVAVLPDLGPSPVSALLPGTLALAIIATSLVNLGIATAYERSYGVLKRLGGSPLTRGGLVAAKIASVLVVESLQVVLLVAIAAGALGWRPGETASVALFLVVLLLGTAVFAGLGLLLAGALRAEATLALANALFVGFLLFGGIVVPVASLPGPIADVARVLPAAALADAFRIAVGWSTQDPAAPVIVLVVWAIVAIVLTVRTFRWD